MNRNPLLLAQMAVIGARNQSLTQTDEALTAPMTQRAKQLDESVQLQFFLRDARDELAWINEVIIVHNALSPPFCWTFATCAHRPRRCIYIKKKT